MYVNSRKKIEILGLGFLVLFYILLQSNILSPISEEIDTKSTSAIPNNADLIGSIDINMDKYSLNQEYRYSITVTELTMYNFTLINIGDANFYVAVANNEISMDYTTDTPSTIETDNLLTSAGVPWWSSYNSWDTISYSNEISNGISLNLGISKSFLLYFDSPVMGDTTEITVIVILRSTANPLNNRLHLEWSTISLTPLDSVVQFSDQEQENPLEIASNSVAKIGITSVGGMDLTYSILNQSISVNNSVTVIRWNKDLSGNLYRSTNTLSAGVENSTLLPSFQNRILSAGSNLALIINPSTTNKVALNWTFHPVSDPTTSYQEISLVDQQIIFKPNAINKIWRVIPFTDADVFNITMQGATVANQTNWNVAVDFYAIGKSTTAMFTANNMGMGFGEAVKIASIPQISSYSDTRTGFSANIFQDFQYWWGIYNSTSPAVGFSAGTQYLGLEITATHGITLLDFYCDIKFNSLVIPDYTDSSRIYLGANNGYAFGDYDLFQVQKFAFTNFDQYKWEINAQNESIDNSNAALYCNSPVSNQYTANMNNALFSIPIDTTGLTGTISLAFDISVQLKANDFVNVYVKNSTQMSATLHTFSMMVGQQSVSYTITPYSAADLQIIFNLTTNAMGIDSGPVIDNVKIWNTTHTAFLDDFEVDFANWYQIDNSFSGLEYWRVYGDDAAYNSPEVDIVYPNTIYTLQGYNANYVFNGFWKSILANNPFVQAGNTGYLVYMANTAYVQNLSAQIRYTAYQPVVLDNSSYLAAIYENAALEFQSGLYWEIHVPSTDFVAYGRLNLDANRQYKITFSAENTDEVTLPCNIFSQNGKEASDLIPNYYGFFLVNYTHIISSTTAQSVYLKFAPIAANVEIHCIIEKVPVPTPEEPTPEEPNPPAPEPTDDTFSNTTVSLPDNIFNILIAGLIILGISNVGLIFYLRKIKKPKMQIDIKKSVSAPNDTNKK